MKGTRSIYNTEPLLNEVELVIKNGLDKILAKTLQRYELLERTHKQLMKLPSIRDELDNGRSDSDSDSSDSDSNSSNSDTKVNTLKQQSVLSSNKDNFVNKDDLFDVYYKIQNLEAKYYKLNGLMDMLIDKIEFLNSDISELERKPKPIANIAIKPSVEPTIVSACQNENIKFEIKEEDAASIEDDAESVEDDAESVEEDAESVEEDADINPALITCSTIKITKEALEVVPNDKVKVVKLEPAIIPESKSVEEEEDDVEEEEEDDVEEEEEVEDSKSVETETKSEKSEEEVDEEEKAKEVDTEDVEEELEVITIDDIDYCTNNEENGFIWQLTEDGEQGDKVGYLKDGEPFFYADEN